LRKDLADEIFRNLFIPHESIPKRYTLTWCLQHLHGEPVALSNLRHQDLIGNRLVALNGRLARLVGVGCPVVRWKKQNCCDYRNRGASFVI
jgi:hypothetical protein